MAKITTTSVISNIVASLGADEIQALYALLSTRTRGTAMRAGGELGHLKGLLQAAGATGEGFQVQVVQGEIWVDAKK